MGIFDLFRKKKKKKDLPEDVKRVFDKIWRVETREQEGRKITDEAISYRNLGNFEKATELLYRALNEFEYTPAAVLVGTTLAMKGDIDDAIRWFELRIKEHGAANDFPLIEFYANLGSIYNRYRKDYAKALQMYASALKALRPAMYDDQAYAQIESNVFHDMAVVYWTLGDHTRARRYVEERLRVQPDCPDCKKIIEQLARPAEPQLEEEGGQPVEQAKVVEVRDGTGEVWGVVKFTGGRTTLFVAKKCLASYIIELAVGIAELKLTPDEKTDFCYWAKLPTGEWKAEHYSAFAIGFVHWLARGADGLSEASPGKAAKLKKVTMVLEKENLPEMPRPLDNKAGELFARHCDWETSRS